MQTGNIPSDAPEYTLAWDILTWAEENIVQPDGENASDPWRFSDEQIRFLAWFYAVDEKGKWLYRTASLRRAKGWGKSPLLAALCIIEFCGPSRFSHWETITDGGQSKLIPIGKREHSPYVQIAATSLDQTKNTMDMVRGMLVASPLVHTIGLDIGKTMIQFKDGRPGVIEPVAANSTTLEGGRPTFAVLDETHLWVENNHGQYVFEVIDRNIGKNAGGRARYIESTNSYNPNQNSIAQQTHEASTTSTDILYDCVEAEIQPDDWDIKDLANEVKLRELVKETYGDSYWIDIDTIVSKIYDPRTPKGVAFRFYLNNVQESADTWITKYAWDACMDDLSPVEPREQIAIGFDGSLYDDSTAIVGCRLTDGKLFVIGLWEKPKDADDDWEVPIGEVDAVMRKAFKIYRVAWAYMDPYFWQTEVDKWAAEFSDKIVFKFPTNRERPMFEALERFHTSVHTQELRHDGDPNLARHVMNAVTRENNYGYAITKERPKSKKKIDLAMAAVLAFEARGDALLKGRMKKRSRAMGL